MLNELAYQLKCELRGQQQKHKTEHKTDDDNDDDDNNNNRTVTQACVRSAVMSFQPQQRCAYISKKCTLRQYCSGSLC